MKGFHEAKEKFQEFLKEEKKSEWIKNMGVGRMVTVLLCGILLLIIALPDGFLAGEDSLVLEGSQKKKNQEEKEEAEEALSKEGYAQYMEEKLVDLLEEVEGVGKVKVMVTLAESQEEVTLKDVPYSQDSVQESDGVGGSRSSISTKQEESSVLVENENGQSVPYVTKTVEPRVEGVVVLAQGAGKAKIENEIIEAVEVLFPISAHKIKVMKMR